MKQRWDGELHDTYSVRSDFAELGLRFPSEYHVREGGILTLGDLRRSIADESLLKVCRIGPKAFEAISNAVERIYANTRAWEQA